MECVLLFILADGKFFFFFFFNASFSQFETQHKRNEPFLSKKMRYNVSDIMAFSENSYIGLV